MAGVDKLKEKILSEARYQAESNIKKVEFESDGILEDAAKEAQKIKEEILKKAGKDAAARKKRKIAVAELEGRKTKLTAKQEIIGELFAKSIEKLNNTPDAEYEKILLEMICERAVGNEEIILSKKDRGRVSADFINKINAMTLAAGKLAGMTLSEQTRQISGGFVLRSGDVEINNSFESIVKTQNDSLEALAVKMLF